MNVAFIHRYPALRLLLPLALGVMCGDTLYDLGSMSLSGLFFLLFLFTALLVLFLYFRQSSYRTRWVFGALTALLMLFLGATLINLYYNATAYRYDELPQTYKVSILQTPDLRERSVRCQVQVIEQIDSIKCTPIQRKAILYLSPDSISKQLTCGDQLLVNARLNFSQHPSHPDAFNYTTYLKRKGVSGSGYVASRKFKVISHSDKLTLTQRAEVWRERIIAYYRKLGFEGDELAILTALTLGDKSELSTEQRENFSVAGASHILAISGMHILFIYTLLCFVLQFLPKNKKYAVFIRNLLIIIVLWGYLFLIGFPPSAVRATTMLTLVILAAALSGERVSLNVLFATALIMLLLHPVWLFDVGFQLSFVAVLSILLIQPLLFNLYKCRSRVGKYLWGVTTLTIAAQLGTAPLVMLYFSRFSTYFLLSGLLLVVQVSFIIYGAFIMLALAPFLWLQQKMVWVVKALLQLLNGTAQWMVTLPSASLDGIWVYRIEVLLFYLILIGVIAFLRRHNAKILITTLLLTIGVLVIGSWYRYSDAPDNRIVIYNQREVPAIHCIAADHHSWIIYGDTLTHNDQLRDEVGRYWNRLHLIEPHAVIDNYCHTTLQVNNGIINFKNCIIAMIYDGRWDDLASTTPLELDYLYLGPNYKGTIQALNRLFVFNRVIIDAGVTPYRLKQWMQECRQLNYSVTAISQQGSHSILL